MKFGTSLVLSLAAAAISHVNASPTGAGGCAGGEAAVGGSHLTRDTETGSLASQDIKLFIDDEEVMEGTPFDVAIGEPHNIKLTMPADSDGFRGFLLRLDGGDDEIDTVDAFSVIPGKGGAVQVAESVCGDVEGVGGFTHRSRLLKQEAEGQLQLDEESDNMNLDVTVVLRNRGQLSAYYYTAYVLNAVAGAPAAAGAAATAGPADGLGEEEVVVDDGDEDTDLGETVTVSEPSDAPEEEEEEEATVEVVEAPEEDEEEGEDAVESMAPTEGEVEVEREDIDHDGVTLMEVSPDCSADMPCGTCLGDCDANEDCEGDLVCFQRLAGDSTGVPGCTGEGTPGTDYCFDAVANPEGLHDFAVECSEDAPCGMCQGDCDNDDQCEGPLACFQRLGTSTETVPGCLGSGFPGMDYCYMPDDAAADGDMMADVMVEAGMTEAPGVEDADVAVEDEDTDDAVTEDNDDESELTEGVCSTLLPCGVCEGDCDFEDQCAGDLECYPRRVGETTPVPGCSGTGIAGLDYCYKPDPTELRVRVTPCSADVPCKKCQADCDDDTHCQGDLKCWQRSTGDTEGVPGCTGTATANLDYCYDPADEELAVAVERNPTLRRRA